MLGPLVGVYKLRLSDAHLPSDDVDDAMRLIEVDDASPFVVQGHQLLHATVATLERIGTVIEPHRSPELSLVTRMSEHWWQWWGVMR